MEPQDQRDQLFERAKVGEITGEEADAEAIRLGLGSLSHQPGPDEFRPEAETQWTLVMAVAWIAYLDLDEVREWSAPYRAECYHWLWQRWQRGFDGPIYEGWHLEQRSKPSLSLLGISDAARSVTGSKLPVMAVSEAEEALWVALREGFFVASGIDTETGRRAEIPALDWHELVAVENKSRVDEVRRGLMASGYREVLVPSAAVRGFWHRREVARPSLPPLMPPTGHGYMPLFCAAQWIATEGGARDFDPKSEEIWRPAFDALMAAIASKKVAVVGRRNGERERVPEIQFVDCPVSYPFADPSFDLIVSRDPYLQSYPTWEDEHGQMELNDALMNARGHEEWARLVVAREDIWREWPFDAVEQTSGAPGRPTSMHLVLAELERRAAQGQLEPSIRKEAFALAAWLATQHPHSAPLIAKSISNKIGPRYRALRNAQK